MRQHLFNFIYQLNKQEKRYFKLYASQLAGEEGNMYTYLFDLIESNKNADEEHIKNEYCKKFEAKTYISTKFYLKEKLLETLRLMQVHTKPTVEQEIQQLMENAAIFYQKNFYSLCEREILRAEKLAEETEQWTLLHNIMEKKLSIYYDIFMNGPNSNFDTVQAIIEKKNAALMLSHQNNDILNILYEIKMHLKYWGSLENQDYIKQLLNSDILQNPPKGIMSQINFYVAKSIIHRYLIENEAYSECYKRVFELWQQNETIKLADVKGYLMQSSNYITSLVINKKIQEAEAVLHYLQKEIPQLKKYFIDHQEVYPPILHAQKVVYLHSANYEELIAMEKRVAPFLAPGNPYFPKTAILEIHYAIAYAYFKTHNYNKALTHINVILHEKEMLNHCSPFYVRCFIVVFLLCHYKLNNFNFLSYEIDRQKEAILKLNANDEVSNAFFKLLRKLCKYPDAQKANLLKYMPAFQAYETEKPTSTVFLSLVAWIKEQLSALPL